MGKKGCGWSESNKQMIEYHDTEWGVPVHNDPPVLILFTLTTFLADRS